MNNKLKATLAAAVVGVGTMVGSVAFAQQNPGGGDRTGCTVNPQECGGGDTTITNNNNSSAVANASNVLKQVFTHVNAPALAASIGNGCTVVEGWSGGIGGFGLGFSLGNASARFMLDCNEAAQFNELVRSGDACMRWVGATAMGIGTQSVPGNTGIAQAMTLLGAQNAARAACTVGRVTFRADLG